MDLTKVETLERGSLFGQQEPGKSDGVVKAVGKRTLSWTKKEWNLLMLVESKHWQNGKSEQRRSRPRKVCTQSVGQSYPACGRSNWELPF